MSPSAVSATPPQATANTPSLTTSAIAQKLAGVAPSNHTAQAPLDASLLTYTRTATPRAVPALSDPIRNVSSFATDHMVTCTWSVETGWATPELKPYGPLSLMPTASVLHYATECFEGLKVYRGTDGHIRLFRPDCNAARLLVSSARIALPTFDPAEVEKLIKALVAVDCAKFLPPDQPGKFLYLRPTLIGTQAELGVQTPKEAMLFIIATYMPELSETPGGMRLLASQADSVRAWPGGFGFAKVGANYGPSLMAQQEARRMGYNQVLWLLGDEAQVTEAGASNFFTVMRNKEGKLQLLTAPLGNKVILDGVTRRSVIQLVKERLAGGEGGLEAIEVVERTYTMGEIVEASEEGRLVECFACGTAFFVAPVSKIHFRGVDIDIPMARGDSGDYTGTIKKWLVDIMYGNEAHPWGVVVEEKAI